MKAVREIEEKHERTHTGRQVMYGREAVQRQSEADVEGVRSGIKGTRMERRSACDCTVLGRLAGRRPNEAPGR